MGISMLGGWLNNLFSGIFNAIFGPIMNWLMGVFQWITNLLFKYIIAPLITFVINIINYVLSILWYNISVFILGLIDYVQILFKLLAGLEVDGIQLNLKGSKSADSDLLLQLILSDSVKNVFLSMCIVGVFLLVITTIFQIIKVEYTTEGAKNAKGPILNKAFKGLCNMIMIPALCICGVFIGNKVLDLLDTATKPDSEATISGQLFVAAASEAFYKEHDITVWIPSAYLPVVVQALTLQIFQITWNSVIDAWSIDDEGNMKGGSVAASEDDGYVKTPDERNQIESDFSSRNNGCDYYNLGSVSLYYDYSRINYLLLIFGGCILIKTLYFTCFGMIVRLYQCGMLFIISPAVIGMTPINEGGLGKWRSDFIGSAISAYGVVLAINIYLILVKILLSIEFNFTSYNDYFLGASLMEGLLKCIIVIGGALYIEKFSGQIGGYFGAKDALAQGKDMEKGVKDQAKKAISTGVTVAMMATGAGGAAVSGVKGLAGAMAKGGLKGGASFVGGGIKKGASSLLDAGEKRLQYFTDGLGINYETRKERKERIGLEEKTAKTGKEVDSAQKKYNAEVAYDKKYEDLKAQRARIDSMEPTSEKDMESKIAKINALDAQIAAMTPQVERRRAEGSIEKSRERLEKAQSVDSDAKKELEAHVSTAMDRQHLRREANRQAGISFFNEKTFLGQNVSAVKKQVSGYEDAAVKNGGDELADAQKHLQKLASKAREDKEESRNKDLIDRKNQAQRLYTESMSIEEVNIHNAKLDNMANNGISNLNSLQSRFNEAKASGDETTAGALASQIESAKSALQERLGLGDNDIKKINGKFEITGNYHLDTETISKMFNRIFKEGKGFNDKQAIQDAVAEAIKGQSASQAKEIQEIFEKVLQRYTKS